MPQGNKGPIGRPYITSKDWAQLSYNNRPKVKGYSSNAIPPLLALNVRQHISWGG
jgi:hypothetical protein